VLAKQAVILSNAVMPQSSVPEVPLGVDSAAIAAPQQSWLWYWRNLRLLPDRIEQFLQAVGFDRAPWLAVFFAIGIGAWFALAGPMQWLAVLTFCGAAAALAGTFARFGARWPYLRLAVVALALAIAAGCATVWSKSALTGAVPITRPWVGELRGEILDRQRQPAEKRVRLTLATREAGTGRAIKVRLNLPEERDRVELVRGAEVQLKARLMPPAGPMLPGSYDFARAAWFSGLSATGMVIGEVAVIAPAGRGGGLREVQRQLSEHIRGRLTGSAGTIAAALASGDRGAIAEADENAMRDAGLAHLLSISGLHVSAVIAAAYVLALRLLGLWPWFALRVRLPLVAAAAGALAGIGYTLLTGAEVPTVRSCIGALLVLLALVLGREPLSLRMLAVGAVLVLLLWPEAIAGPSFQMSFAAVLAIVALHGAAPIRTFLAPREEPWWQRGLRRLSMLLLTGIVIEFALLPIGLFHFHRAGVYGALANVIAIPLTTFVTMPLIALALLFDLVGAGAPVWWLAGKSLELLIGLAHWTAARPGAVSLLPAMGLAPVLLFVAGGLWLALWSGRIRLLGLVPAWAGAVALLFLRPPDVLVSGDGRHVGIVGEAKGELLVLREGKSDFARENLLEAAGMEGETRPLDDWPGARCNANFCAVTLRREGRDWHLLLSRGRDYVPERQLAAVCDTADIVIADRWLPQSCQPRWFKADRKFLERTGGLAIDLGAGKVTTVSESQGHHGWWRGAVPAPEPQTAQ
jgi:competence protein ComEC